MENVLCIIWVLLQRHWFLKRFRLINMRKKKGEQAKMHSTIVGVLILSALDEDLLNWNAMHLQLLPQVV